MGRNGEGIKGVALAPIDPFGLAITAAYLLSLSLFQTAAAKREADYSKIDYRPE